ncbi:MAG: alpha/beta fold hydrolase [Candidatus Eisenbacteria bacterium]|nr:alpha/beta fold hydrolase [Candidatus Eisenbacteria bacterium]
MLPLILATTVGAIEPDGTLVARAPVSYTGNLRRLIDERIQRSGRVLDLDSVLVQRITYMSDGLKVRGYLVEPISGDSLPAIIFNRGGNREFGAITDTSAALLLGPLAQHGYVVVASQYRGNAGGEGREEFGGADVNDVLNLVPLLERQPRVDATRLGMYGWSRGGMMTYLALARTDRIRAAVVGAGLSDAADMVRQRPEMETGVLAELVPGWPAIREAALEARSAVRWPERLNPTTPILLLQGSADWRVEPTETLRMAEALYKAKRPVRFVFLEGGDHGLSEHRAEVARQVNYWFDTYVRDRAPLPNLVPHGK